MMIIFHRPNCDNYDVHDDPLDIFAIVYIFHGLCISGSSDIKCYIKMIIIKYRVGDQVDHKVMILLFRLV